MEARLPHDTPLIATIVAGLGLAFLFGLLAHRLRLPPIAGYLMAGVLIGPFTPGYVADQNLSSELAELGVILLMFGVGLHFSPEDLMKVRAIAVPGAIGQIAVATVMGMGLGWMLGWGWGAGLVFGLALSVASTVVLLRALQERRLVETERGRIAVGWLIVEDLAMVLALVLIPPLAGLLGGTAQIPPGTAAALRLIGLDETLGPVWGTLLLTAVKVATFVALMLVIGRKLIPWVLHYVAHTGSRELFRLAVLAIALGVAYGATHLFGVSFALGAFFAGMVLAESQLSHQAANETLPLRDAFAVLFFVSVGMLFNPSVLLEHPFAVLAAILVIVLGKSAAAYFIVRAFRHPKSTALTISVSLAQIGEFSFILVVLGVALGILPALARDLIVAGALVSILANPILFFLQDRLLHRTARTEADVKAAAVKAKGESSAADVPTDDEDMPDMTPTALTGHAVLIGHGRVGSRVAAALRAAHMPFLVVEDNADAVRALKAQGIEAYAGLAGTAGVLDLVNLKGARCLISAIPDPFEAGTVVARARMDNPSLHIVARAHSTEGVESLRHFGADTVLMGEEEIARGIVRDILPPAEAEAVEGSAAMAGIVSPEAVGADDPPSLTALGNVDRPMEITTELEPVEDADAVAETGTAAPPATIIEHRSGDAAAPDKPTAV